MKVDTNNMKRKKNCLIMGITSMDDNTVQCYIDGYSNKYYAVLL